MPKEEFSIGQFEGGLMNSHDPRDIPDNALARATNVMVDRIGKIRPMGSQLRHPSIGGPESSNDPSETYISANAQPGTGFFAFGADNPVDKNSGQNLVTIANPGTPSSGKSNVTMAAGTNDLSKGDWIYIEGSTISGRFKVESITTPTVFVITNTVTPGANERFYWYRDINAYRESDLYACQDRQQIHIIDQTQLINQISLYSDNTNDDVKPTFYSVNDALRVCDGNFKNSSNTPKWFGYLPERTQFINHAETLGADYWEEHTTGTYAGGTLTSESATGFDMDVGSGEQIINSEDDLTLQDGITIKLTFDLTLQASHTVNPVVYLTESQNQLPANAVSEVRLATGGAGSAQSNTIYLTPRVSSSSNGCLNFYTNGNADYLVANLTIEHVSYIPAGWYAENQELPTPSASTFVAINDDVTLHDSSIADHDSTLQLYKVGIAEPGSAVIGEFQGGTDGDQRYNRLGMSYVFYDGQESKVFEDSVNISLATAGTAINATVQSCSYADSFDGSTFIDHRITGCRIYLMASGTTTSTLVYPTEPELLIEVDNIEGARWFNGDWEAWTADAAPNDNVAHVTLTNLTTLPLYDYMTLNTYSSTVNSLSCRYKTAVIANNRCYVGNVEHPVIDDQSASGTIVQRHFGDKIIKSPPKRYDTFPSENVGEITHVLDVAPGDGDSIVKLMEFANKLIVFKKKNIYIVDISQDLDLLESTYKGIGIGRECASVDTPFGPVWVNNSGCHFYDGEKVVNLIENKIDKTNWNEDIDSTKCGIGYIFYMQQIVIFKNLSYTWGFEQNNEDTYIYDFATESWTKGIGRVSPSPKSNMQNNPVGDMIYLTSHTISENSVHQVTQEAVRDYAYGSIVIHDGDFDQATYLHMYNGSAWKRVSGALPEESWIESGGPHSPWDLNQDSRDNYMEAFVNAINMMNNTSDAGHLDLQIHLSGQYQQGFVGKYSFGIWFSSGETNGEQVQFTDAQYVDQQGSLEVHSPLRSFVFSTQEDYSGGTGGNAPYGYFSGNNPGVHMNEEPLTGITSNTVQISTIEYHREGSTEDGVMWYTTVALTSAPDTSGETYYLGEVTASYETAGGDDDDTAVALGIKNAFDAIVAGEADFVPTDHITFSNSGGILTLTGKNTGAKFVTSSFAARGEGLDKGSEVSYFNNKPSVSSLLGISPVISTKDFDFASPGVKKKIYKVYVTYKYTSGAGVKPTYSVNGSLTTEYDFDSIVLSASTDWNTVSLKPKTSSEANGVYSIQVHFNVNLDAATDSTATESVLPKGFEINDITIVYRKKSIK